MPLAAEAAAWDTVTGAPIERQPGDLCACRISGAGGIAIDFAQWLNGAKAFSHWDHVKVYVGDGKILQAEPGGAQIISQPVIPGELWSTGIPSLALSEEQQARVPALAETYRGIGYSALDYQALAAHRLHLPDLPVWPEPKPGGGHRLVTLQDFIGATGHQMCSQLADDFRLRLGSHLFDDNRWPGYVTPFDIGDLITRLAR